MICEVTSVFNEHVVLGKAWEKGPRVLSVQMAAFGVILEKGTHSGKNYVE